MKQVIVLAVIAIVGLGVGATGGILIVNSKSKATIADMQSKIQQSEASSQETIRNYNSIINQLTNELQQAKNEIEKFKTPAPAADQAIISALENQKTDAAPGSSIPEGTNLYTIQSGDSLWSIAQKQLGNGDRFKEILKLNPRISAKSNLTIGTKLTIPAK